MAKRTTTYELMLPQRDPGQPAYRWLYAALRDEILEGRLRPGARLPGSRDLGRQYGLSRGTIVNAFEQLRAEGYVAGSVGSGTFVSKILPDELLQIPHRPEAQPRPSAGRQRELADFARRVQPFSMLEARSSRAFRPNLPALDLFPATLWAQVAARRLRRISTKLLLGCEPTGYRPLQDAVADYLSTSRGVSCTAEQVVIVSGVQEALDLTARLLLNPGDRVGMEEPGYIGAGLLFEAVGARICALPVDGEGMRLPEPGQPACKLVYVTPAHHFPLGATMSLARRLALLEWARGCGALILEDDYDSEFRYAGRPVPALQGLDRHALVLYAGGFNKVLFPSLRLGYLVVPHDLVPRFAASRSVTIRHPPLLPQAILCDFIGAGHFGRHLRRMRQVYAERLGVLLEGARRSLAGLLEVSGVEAGLQTAGWLRPGLGAVAAARAAARRDVEVTPLNQFYRGPVEREGLLLGFGAVDTGEIRRGIRELAAALEAASTAGAG
jgi:GntR family transcriptional regulator / MocR family aminotransferase